MVSFTHDRELPWLLPGLAPTGRQAQVLAISVVSVRHRSRAGRTTSLIAAHRTLWDQVGLLTQLHPPPAGRQSAFRTVSRRVPDGECSRPPRRRRPRRAPARTVAQPVAAVGVRRSAARSSTAARTAAGPARRAACSPMPDANSSPTSASPSAWSIGQATSSSTTTSSPASPTIFRSRSGSVSGGGPGRGGARWQPRARAPGRTGARRTRTRAPTPWRRRAVRAPPAAPRPGWPRAPAVAWPRPRRTAPAADRPRPRPGTGLGHAQGRRGDGGLVEVDARNGRAAVGRVPRELPRPATQVQERPGACVLQHGCVQRRPPIAAGAPCSEPVAAMCPRCGSALISTRPLPPRRSAAASPTAPRW